MGFSIVYKKLFEVRLLHHYFLDVGGKDKAYTIFDKTEKADRQRLLKEYRLEDFIFLQPTASCAAQLRKHQCVCRITTDRLVVLIKAEFDKVANRFKPFIELPSSLHFVFACYLTDTFFTNYTLLPLERPKDAVYYFNNQVNNTKKAYPALTAIPPEKDDTKLYSAGEILIDDANAPSKILIANQLNENNSPKQTFEEDVQIAGKPLFYANRNDWFKLSSDLLVFDTEKPNLNPTITITNRKNETVKPLQEIIQSASTLVRFNFALLPEDVYNVKLEDSINSFLKAFSFFLWKGGGPTPDALIDIAVDSDNKDFSLLEEITIDGKPKRFILADDKVRSFEIRFKNRRTLWRYRGEKFTSQPVVGPYALTKNGFVSDKLTNDDGVEVTDPPNPTVSMMKTEKLKFSSEHYNSFSETFIH